MRLSKIPSICTLILYFNPRTPGGVRRQTLLHICARLGFQSTHPGWGATLFLLNYQILYFISIHAPRVGCDLISAAFPLFHIDFNPRTPGGVRHYYPDINAPLVRHFNPRTPGGVRLYIVQIGKTRHKNFNPRTPGGVRLQGHRGCQKERYFNPRTPGGVRLDCLCRDADCSRISIHAPRVGCDYTDPKIYVSEKSISIHAPRVGCDLYYLNSTSNTLIISIHAPRVGCDAPTTGASVPTMQFQSTHPGWGATLCTPLPIRSFKNFNPRTPGGVRPFLCEVVYSLFIISIHAPRVGCDFNRFYGVLGAYQFQSTHPGWGATCGFGCGR